jgi:hypothetical protein
MVKKTTLRYETTVSRTNKKVHLSEDYIALSKFNEEIFYNISKFALEVFREDRSFSGLDATYLMPHNSSIIKIDLHCGQNPLGTLQDVRLRIEHLIEIKKLPKELEEIIKKYEFERW